MNSAKNEFCVPSVSEKNKGNKMNSGAGEEEAEVEKEKEGTELGGWVEKEGNVKVWRREIKK